MTVVIHGIASCDTCRKARKALPQAAFRDIRDDPLTPSEIDAVIARFGAAAVNRASTTWRRLDAGERGSGPAALLAAHPTLLKRPLIRDGDTLHLGWTAEIRAALDAE